MDLRGGYRRKWVRSPGFWVSGSCALAQEGLGILSGIPRGLSLWRSHSPQFFGNCHLPERDIRRAVLALSFLSLSLLRPRTFGKVVSHLSRCEQGWFHLGLALTAAVTESRTLWKSISPLASPRSMPRIGRPESLSPFFDSDFYAPVISRSREYPSRNDSAYSVDLQPSARTLSPQILILGHAIHSGNEV